MGDWPAHQKTTLEAAEAQCPDPQNVTCYFHQTIIFVLVKNNIHKTTMNGELAVNSRAHCICLSSSTVPSCSMANLVDPCILPDT